MNQLLQNLQQLLRTERCIKSNTIAERDILTHSGKVEMEVAKALALEQFERYNHRRLVQEAERDALADDAELARIAKRLDGKVRR